MAGQMAHQQGHQPVGAAQAEVVVAGVQDQVRETVAAVAAGVLLQGLAVVVVVGARQPVVVMLDGEQAMPALLLEVGGARVEAVLVAGEAASEVADGAVVRAHKGRQTGGIRSCVSYCGDLLSVLFACAHACACTVHVQRAAVRRAPKS